MKTAIKLLKKVIKKSGDENAQWLCGAEFSSEAKPRYQAVIRFTKEGVIPVTIIGKTEEELCDEIKKYLINPESGKDITVRFLEGKIEQSKEVIRFYENLIKDHEQSTST